MGATGDAEVFEWCRDYFGQAHDAALKCLPTLDIRPHRFIADAKDDLPVDVVRSIGRRREGGFVAGTQLPLDPFIVVFFVAVFFVAVFLAAVVLAADGLAVNGGVTIVKSSLRCGC